MTDTVYILGCCNGEVATVAVDGAAVAVAILNADGTEPHRMVGWIGVDDPLIQQARELLGDRMHSSIMAAALEYPVTEIVWESPDDVHRSWTIHCSTCGQMVPVTESKLSRLAHLLTTGDWSQTGGVALLGVLKAKM